MTHRKGEKFCKLFIKGLIARIYKEFQKLNNKRINNPINKWVNKLNIQFSEEVQMVNKYMKKCSTPSDIKEMQIKMTLKVHLTPVKLAIIKKTKNNKCWQECRKKRNPHTLVGM
jgi:hypothetical protein